jgi:hypothetical protein
MQIIFTRIDTFVICNAFHNPSIPYVDLHKLQKQALPNNFCTYRHCLLLFKIINNKISKRHWLNLNFQLLNTSRQTRFEIRNCSVHKAGNNTLSNQFSCINIKIQLYFLIFLLKLLR